jgi:hypothetical protein
MNRLLLAAAVLAALFVSAAAWAQTITISVSSNAAGAALAGSGTKSTSFDFGTVSRMGGVVPIGVTRTTSSSDWTLSMPFDVTVTKDVALTSASYTLQAQLSLSDGVRTWSADSIPLSTTSATITVAGTYASTAPHTFALKIPDNATAGAFSNTLTLTAVSN